MEREIKEIKTECVCGCMTLKIQKDENFSDKEVRELELNKEDQYNYIFEFLESKFYSKQRSILSTIGHRLKFAWYILIGKEYLLEDMIFTEKQIKELINDLQEIIK